MTIGRFSDNRFSSIIIRQEVILVMRGVGLQNVCITH